MELCSNGHEEVVYEGRSCPFCAYVDEAKGKINDLEAKVEDAESELRSIT